MPSHSGLPDKAVEAMVDAMCRVLVPRKFGEDVIAEALRRALTALPAGVYVVKDGQVAYRTEEEAVEAAQRDFSVSHGRQPPNYAVLSQDQRIARAVLAALSATDTESAT